MSKNKWTLVDMPDLSGKTAVVTGANSGLGYEAARGLAQKNAHVVMACRSMQKGQDALNAIRADLRGASLELMELDLANLASVHAFAESYLHRYGRLDVLLNNAGVMALPFRRTADGFEMQFGTNHLGHFALTGLLLDSILSTPGARVVTVSSGVHRWGSINFDDINSEREYSKWGAYGQSKLANLLFMFELQRRLESVGADAISVGAHPGYAATNLQTAGPNMEGASLQKLAMSLLNKVMAQSQVMGALPLLYASAAPDVRGGEYFGPDGLQESRGYPTRVGTSAAARDTAVAARLWALSEEMTGVSYAALEGSRAAAPSG